LEIDPAGIDTVVFTHLHGDHIVVTVSSGGNPFTNATLRVAQADIDFWTSEEIQPQAPDAFKSAFDLPRTALVEFGERVEALEGEARIVPGLTTAPLPGHAVGHSGLRLESGGAQLLIAAGFNACAGGAIGAAGCDDRV